MFQEERLKDILQHLNRQEKITVEDICRLFGVSRDTARRDIVKLEEQGLITRARGGAVLPPFTKHLMDYEQRLKSESAHKQAIGKAAAALVRPGDYLILDASTTVQQAAAQFATAGHVIVTNSADIAGLLAREESNDVYLLGGKLHPQYRYISGPRAISQLAEYNADKLFLGTGGLGPEGVFSFTEEYGFLMREMIARAEQTILLADHTKFNKKTFHFVSGWDSIDMLVTNQPPDEAMQRILDQHQVKWIQA
ncbi:MAG: DeoR family transcriptional regulator [Paenibacillus sp.]|jgi:DeoR/GlpR family transcriptional regulator of sugar metabolism|nr:DeoR family transcriptional regulator [Paenibacillus sp.]